MKNFYFYFYKKEDAIYPLPPGLVPILQLVVLHLTRHSSNNTRVISCDGTEQAGGQTKDLFSEFIFLSPLISLLVWQVRSCPNAECRTSRYLTPWVIERVAIVSHYSHTPTRRAGYPGLSQDLVGLGAVQTYRGLMFILPD